MRRFLFLTVVLLGIGAGTKAQSLSDLRYELVVGMNTAAVSDPFSEGVLGFNIGAKATVPLKVWGKGNLYGAASLLYTKKGGKKDNSIDALMDDDMRIKSGYLSLPIHVGYEYNFNEKVGVFLDAGPYIAYGLNGNHFGSDEDDFTLKRFDAGVGYGFGVRFKERWAISINMHLGLMNLKKGDVDYSQYEGSDKWRNTNVEMSLQWVIGRK